MANTTRKYIRLVAPNGPSLVRHVARTLLQSARADNADPDVELPSLRERAKFVVHNKGLFVAQDDL